MQIETLQKQTGYQITVTDVIKTIEDSTNFKKAVTDVLSKQPTAKVDIHIRDSYIITSSIIGTLLKIVQKDNANISIFVYSADLYELLDKLNLLTLLNVRKEF